VLRGEIALISHRIYIPIGIANAHRRRLDVATQKVASDSRRKSPDTAATMLLRRTARRQVAPSGSPNRRRSLAALPRRTSLRHWTRGRLQRRRRDLADRGHARNRPDL